MKIQIKDVANGYIVDIYSGGEKDTEVIEDNDDEKEAFIRLVNVLAENLGFSYDKWKTDNLEVSFSKPGHKVEETTN